MREILKSVRHVGLLIVALAYLQSPSLFGAEPPPPICEEVCNSSSHCEDECYLNMMEFENGNATTCNGYGTCDPAAAPEYCGNFFCGDGETHSNCSADCNLGIGDGPSCGNSSCELGEDSRNCPADCTALDQCGDDVCDLGENAGNCPGDCYQAGFCSGSNSHFDCQEEYGSGYICSRQRCVYEPGAQWCDPQRLALDCPSPAMKCINNVCTEVF